MYILSSFLTDEQDVYNKREQFIPTKSQNREIFYIHYATHYKNHYKRLYKKVYLENILYECVDQSMYILPDNYLMYMMT